MIMNRHAETNPALEKLQRRYMWIVTLTSILVASIGVFITLGFSFGLDIIEFDPRILAIELVVMIVSALVLYLIQAGHERQANSLLITAYTALAMLPALQAQAYFPIFFVLAVLAIVTAAILGSRTFFILNCIVLICGWMIAVAQFQLNTEAVFMVRTLLGSGVILVFLATITRLVVHVTTEITTVSQRTADLLEASASLGQAMSRVLDPQELMPRAVELIRDRFAFYHVQIFLLDDSRQYAELVAGTGTVGKQLMARNHRLPVGSQSVIGQVTATGQPVIANAGEHGGLHAFNELLPDTQSELAIPIMDGELIIGALDVQSLRPDAFSDTDIQALRVMASQLATAIRNAELFEIQNQSLRENQRLFQDAEKNLHEIQRLNRQLTGQAWKDYLMQPEIESGVLVNKDRQLRDFSEWTDNMKQAFHSQKTVVESRDSHHIIALPLQLRGEIIGAIELETQQDNPQYIVSVLEAISEQLAIRLDNARLFEETQRATAREQKLNEMIGFYQSADTVGELLEVTLKELCEVVDADEGSIRIGNLGINSTPPPRHKQNGGA